MEVLDKQAFNVTAAQKDEVMRKRSQTKMDLQPKLKEINVIKLQDMIEGKNNKTGGPKHSMKLGE